MEKPKNLNRIVVVVSSMMTGFMLHLFLDNRVLETFNAAAAMKLLEASLLVVAVVSFVAWLTHRLVLSGQKQDS